MQDSFDISCPKIFNILIHKMLYVVCASGNWYEFILLNYHRPSINISTWEVIGLKFWGLVLLLYFQRPGSRIAFHPDASETRGGFPLIHHHTPITFAWTYKQGRWRWCSSWYKSDSAGHVSALAGRIQLVSCVTLFTRILVGGVHVYDTTFSNCSIFMQFLDGSWRAGVRWHWGVNILQESNLYR